MKSLIMKAFLGMVVILLLEVPVCLAAGPASEVFLLEGLEIAKGIDIGSIRIGTSFAGKVLDGYGEEEQGFWSVSLNHRGATNIEECGGTNDIYSFRLENCVHDSEFSGHHGSSLLRSQRIRFSSRKLCAQKEEPSNETHPIYGRRGSTAQRRSYSS